MAQYKIPQEVNVEDKIIGPFTLKGFAFVMAFVIAAIIFLVIFSSLGLGFFPSLIIGCLFGSVFLILGFVPFNGKPLYMSFLPFINFLAKPRQRAWKREQGKKMSQKAPASQDAQTKDPLMLGGADYTPPKEDIETAEKRMEEIALTVDTGGAYGQGQTTSTKDPKDIFNSPKSAQIENDLEKAKERVERQSAPKEPPVSDLATVDPDKEFEYEKPDTSKYKIE